MARLGAILCVNHNSLRYVHWIFGYDVEDRLGHGRLIVFYLLAGLLQAVIDRADSDGCRFPDFWVQVLRNHLLGR